VKEQKLPWRSLHDVSYEELKQAVTKMCAELGIHGSGNGYSLYNAVFAEKRKVTSDENANLSDYAR
jgi:hypothetical protein